MKQVLEYEKKALDSIPDNHPHGKEIRELLNAQIKDDLQTHANSRPTK